MVIISKWINFSQILKLVSVKFRAQQIIHATQILLDGFYPRILFENVDYGVIISCIFCSFWLNWGESSHHWRSRLRIVGLVEHFGWNVCEKF